MSEEEEHPAQEITTAIEKFIDASIELRLNPGGLQEREYELAKSNLERKIEKIAGDSSDA